MNHVVTRLEGEGDLGDVHAPVRAPALAVHARVEVGEAEDGEMRRGDHDSGRDGASTKVILPRVNVGRRAPALIDAARIERIHVALEELDANARPAHGAGVLGRRLEGLLERDVLIGEGELHRLARAAVGNREHAGEAVVDNLLDPAHEAVVRTREGRLLDLELRRHRSARTDEAYVVEALLTPKVKLLRPHVEPVEARDLRV